MKTKMKVAAACIRLALCAGILTFSGVSHAADPFENLGELKTLINEVVASESELVADATWTAATGRLTQGNSEWVTSVVVEATDAAGIKDTGNVLVTQSGGTRQYIFVARTGGNQQLSNIPNTTRFQRLDPEGGAFEDSLGLLEHMSEVRADPTLLSPSQLREELDLQPFAEMGRWPEEAVLRSYNSLALTRKTNRGAQSFRSWFNSKSKLFRGNSLRSLKADYKFWASRAKATSFLGKLMRHEDAPNCE